MLALLVTLQVFTTTPTIPDNVAPSACAETDGTFKSVCPSCFVTQTPDDDASTEAPELDEPNDPDSDHGALLLSTPVPAVISYIAASAGSELTARALLLTDRRFRPPLRLRAAV